MKKSLVVMVVLSLLLASVSSALLNNGWAVANTTDVSLVRTFVGEDGRQIDELVFPGKPPEVSHVTSVSVPEPHIEMGINNLSNVPAFDWSYGCSSTSAAMLFGYYDRTGYNSMYTGTTNGGMCPLDNSVWGGSECPLSATHQGIDGQTERAHVGDYWINYGHNGPDPYIVDGLSEHVHYACTADFMGTNQSKFGNPDGCTTFYCSTNGDPLYDYTGAEPMARDGCHGMRLFAESRGYTVLENYSQYIEGQGSDPNRGFTFEDFMAEINAGRPVLIHVVGHTMLGYGYDTTSNIIYIHSTWDYSDHQMTWGGTFSGLQHKMVTVIRLAGGAPPQTPDEPPSVTTDNAVNVSQTSASLVGSLQDKGSAETVEVSFQWGTSPGFYANETTPETLSATGVFDAQLSGLQANITYYYRAKAVGDGTDYGTDRQFTTSQETPTEPAVITNEAVNVGQTSASLVGSLKDKGSAEIVEVSFQWGTSAGTYANETIGETLSAAGVYDAQLSGLQANTTYYYRARAVGDGTDYGSQKQFTTSQETPIEPTVATNDAANISQTSASLVGSLQDKGSAETVEVSFQWGTSPGSYANETITETLSTAAIFDAQLTNLQPNTTYYYRARAVGDGTDYGSQKQFTTSQETPTEPAVITNEAVNVGQTSASLVGSLKDKGSAEIVEVSFQWGTSAGSYPNETITETLSTTAIFDAQLTNLQPNTTYYYRARAVGDGTDYGSERQFTTSQETPIAPSLITNEAVNISQTLASLVGSLQDKGSAETVEVSFQWGTSAGTYTNETIAETLSATGVYDAQLSGLQANTTYYYRAKAVGDGTNYGLDKSFITSHVGEVIVSIKPKNQTVPSGGSFSIDVEVDTRGIPITACDVTVTFDPHLAATLLTGAELLGTAGLDVLYLPTIDAGEVSYGGARIGGPVAVNGDFVTIDFNVDPAATGTYDLVVTATVMDSNGDPLAVVDNDGRVKIRTKGRKGDFDRDGNIKFLDFVQFADAYGSEVGDPNYNATGDFDDDGYIIFFDFVDFADVYGQ